MPLEKRIAELKAAGLRTAYDRDKKYFDDVVGNQNIEFIPPLPRHIPADLSDVSDLYHHYQERKMELEQRIQKMRQDAVAEKKPEEPASSDTPPGA